MSMPLLEKAPITPWAVLDSKGDILDGSKTYKLHVPPNPPVKDFWAITMYDTQTRSQLQTDQQFPTLEAQDEGMKTNADGSIDIYFSPKAPEGHGGQLAADHSRKKLVHCPAHLRTRTSPGSTRPGVRVRSSSLNRKHDSGCRMQDARCRISTYLDAATRRTGIGRSNIQHPTSNPNIHDLLT